jgi:hypothetical protein
MGVNEVMLPAYVYPTKWYDNFKVKNALVKAVYCVIECTICSYVYFCFQVSLKTLVTALILVTTDGYDYVFHECVNGAVSENSEILMHYFSHNKTDETLIV